MISSDRWVTACLPTASLPHAQSRTRYQTLRIAVRLASQLGEGGFSYVYLVKETVSQQLFACKKVREEVALSSASSQRPP